MKQLYSVLLLALVVCTPARAQFVEQFRSEPKRRMGKALRNIVTDKVDSDALDMNRNGFRDTAIIQFSDIEQPNQSELQMFDGLAQTPLWRFPLSEKLGIEDFDYLGFFGFKGDGEVSALIFDGKGNDVWVINPSTNEIEFSAENARLIGVANVDSDEPPEIIYADLTPREIVIIGWQNGGLNASSSAMAELLSPVVASKSTSGYELTMKYESAPGHDLAFDPAWFESAQDLDLEGDGRLDLVLVVENQIGEAIGIVVSDGTDANVKWQFPYPQEHLEDLGRGFHGFYNVAEDNEKAAFFGHRTVVTLDGEVHLLDANFEILVITDLDNDGYPELIGRGLADSTVQVWGAATTTGVFEENLSIAGFQLFQNYPNPFNPSTTISYSVAKTGSVDLKIYNSLGQLVRTLFSGQKAAGEYTLNWDGRDAAGRLLSSGQYFYRLKTGEVVQTRRMLFLK